MGFRILLASQSQVKREAVQEALRALGLIATISTVQVDSGVNAQPYGRKEIFRGAVTRAKEALILNEEPDLILGIETGIERVDPVADLDDCFYQDVSAIYALYGPENPIPIFSQTVPMPYEAVEATMKKTGGFKHHTVGQTMVELGMATQHDDPYEQHFRLSRVTVIAYALESIFHNIDFGNNRIHV
jgi:non-canonical (house-cleaning) NTP pyrophosphatase